MAESQDGSPEASKPPPAAIPDLKKALENKPAPFTWAPGAARSAASVALVGAQAKAPSALDRLNTTPGRLAALAVLMIMGGAGLSFTAFQERPGGGAGELGGVRSTIKPRAFQGRDSVGFSKGYGPGNEPAAGKSGMNFDLIKAGEKALNIEIPQIPGVPGADGEVPMNYDEGSTGKAGAAGGAAAGMDGAAGDADGAGGGLAGGGAPKLGSSYGKINFQGMRRVSGTAGFRGIKASPPNQMIKTRGSAASSTGGAGAGRGGAGSATAPLTPFSGNNARAGASGGGSGAGAAAGAGGGGSGGGGPLDVAGLQSTVDQNLPSIPDLMAQAAAKREAADKEEKKAKILAATGHFPQAHYHYDRAKKKNKEADQLENQANQQLNAITVEADGLNEQDPP